MKTMSTCQCNGLLARVKREVFAAAVMERSAERDDLLAFWQGMHRRAEAVYHLNGLYHSQRKHPTRQQRADARESARYGGWIGSQEYRDEQRAMGLSAL